MPFSGKRVAVSPTLPPAADDFEVPDSEPEREAKRRLARDSRRRKRVVISESEDESEEEDDNFDVFLSSKPPSKRPNTSKHPQSSSSIEQSVLHSQDSAREASQMIVVCTQSSESQCSSFTNASQVAIAPSSPVSQAARLRELDELAEYHAQRGSDGVTNAARADRNAGDERHSTPPVSPRRGRAVGNNRGRGVQSPVAGPSRGAAATPRSTRSARNAITPEQRTLREFAVQLFNDLSKNVFEGRIGTETDLLWNNRLTRTAGKAHYSRHTNGAFESRIELSTKVVDREERIRNTLGHEMCHLAVWMIDGIYDPSHGDEWGKWAKRVMKHNSLIVIKPTHTYQIDYPFNWKCTNCNRVYGRYTNSLNANVYVCICQRGELVPVEANAIRNANGPVALVGHDESSDKAAQPRLRTGNAERERVPVVVDTSMDVETDTEGVDNIICGMGSFTITDFRG